MDKIEFMNGSVIWVTTDGPKWKHVRGKSMKFVKLDEYDG